MWSGDQAVSPITPFATASRGPQRAHDAPGGREGHRDRVDGVRRSPIAVSLRPRCRSFSASVIPSDSSMPPPSLATRRAASEPSSRVANEVSRDSGVHSVTWVARGGPVGRPWPITHVTRYGVVTALRSE